MKMISSAAEKFLNFKKKDGVLENTSYEEFTNIATSVLNVMNEPFVDPISGGQMRTWELHKILEECESVDIKYEILSWIRLHILKHNPETIQLGENVKNLYKAILTYEGFTDVDFVNSTSSLYGIKSAAHGYFDIYDEKSILVIVAPIHVVDPEKGRYFVHKDKKILTDSFRIEKAYILDSIIVTEKHIHDVIMSVRAMRW